MGNNQKTLKYNGSNDGLYKSDIIDVKDLKVCKYCIKFQPLSSFYNGKVEICLTCIKSLAQEEQDDNVNKIIIDHYLKYPRGSLFGNTNVNNEEVLLVPRKQIVRIEDVFKINDDNTFLKCSNYSEYYPLSNYIQNSIMICRHYIRRICDNAKYRYENHIKKGKKGNFNLTPVALNKICDDYNDRCAITRVKFVRRPDEPISILPNRNDNSITYDTIYSEDLISSALNTLLNLSLLHTSVRNSRVKRAEGVVET
ncbi:hypothetical protein ACTFIY_009901 [Dictyostelium cf. discoideum]